MVDHGRWLIVNERYQVPPSPASVRCVQQGLLCRQFLSSCDRFVCCLFFVASFASYALSYALRRAPPVRTCGSRVHLCSSVSRSVSRHLECSYCVWARAHWCASALSDWFRCCCPLSFVEQCPVYRFVRGVGVAAMCSDSLGIDRSTSLPPPPAVSDVPVPLLS